MPKVDLYNMNGQVIGEIELSDKVFGVDINEYAVHAAVVNQLANKRQGTQSVKTKSEVSGGGAKPYRQKGTGRARQGSIRSAQWRKGGIVLGPKPRSYEYAIPKKLKRLALKSALTSKVDEKNIYVIDELKYDEIKTKQIAALLSDLKIDASALIVLGSKDDVIVKSARNIPGVKTAIVNTINTYDVLKYDKLIATRESVEKIGEVYA